MRKKSIILSIVLFILIIVCPQTLWASENQMDDYDGIESTEDIWSDSSEESNLKPLNMDEYYVASSLKELNQKIKSFVYEDLYDKCRKRATYTEDGFVIYNDILLDIWKCNKKIQIPSTITKIYGVNFTSTNLEGGVQIIIPNSVVDIRNSFCTNMGDSESIEIIFENRNGIPLKIGNSCFNGSSDRQNYRVSIPKETTEIGYDCFNGCNLINFVIPDGIKVIRANCFSNNLNMRIEIPESVTKIEDNCFSGGFTYNNARDDVSTLKVPSTVKSIGKECFRKLDTKGVVCAKNSVAEKYCKKNRISYSTNKKVRFSHPTYYICEGTVDLIPFYTWDQMDNVTYSIKNAKCADIIPVSAPNTFGIWTYGKKEGTTVLTAKYKGKTYTAKIIVIKLTENNRVKQAVHNVTTSDMSKYEKVYLLSQWLRKQCDYDFSGGSIHKHSPYTSKGVLLDGLAVCSGYAKALNLLGDKAGLESKYVSGTLCGGGHAWNLYKNLKKRHKSPCSYI